MALTTIILSPLLGIILVLITDSNKRETMKLLTLSSSIISFGISIYLWVVFDSAYNGYQFMVNYGGVSFCELRLGIDGLSLYYVLLTTLLMPISIVAGWSNIKSNLKSYLVCILIIEVLTLAIFTVMDLILFYVTFEAVLIPMFLMVGIWGASESRIRAAFLLFIYTLAGSLFMLLAILSVYSHTGTSDMVIISLSDMEVNTQRIIWLGFGIAFAVKTPLVPFHIWLPRAHAEAPLAGSIILAGLVLKLATYGILRVMLSIMPEATSYFTPITQVVAVVTIVYSSLATLRQSDTKALIAYSSVAHMGIVTLGIFSNSIEGIEGAILLSIAHGFVSPALFLLVGGVLYSRYHTRVIRYYRGLALYMPIFATMMFIFTLFNMAVPLSLNWLGELLSLAGAFNRSPIMASIGASSIILSAAYSIWLYARMVTGSWSPYLRYAPDINREEFIVLVPLLMLTVIFGIYPEIILTDLHSAVSNLLYSQ